MFVSLSGRAHACALGLVFGLTSLFSAAALGADSVAKEGSPPPGEAVAVELFACIEGGKVEATIVPRDSKKVTLQLKNKSDQPLAIRLPEAFAAVPVQAQVGGGGLFGGGNPFGAGANGGGDAGGQGGGAQGLGVAGGQNGGFNNGGGGRNRRGGGPDGPMIFNVPAGKVVKVKLAAVCLEYGKPEPSAKLAYEIKPLASFCDKPEIASILRSLGAGQVSQEVAQLAAWNVASGTSFEQIASMKSKIGLQQPVYSESAISAAAKLVDVVAAQADAGKEDAASSAKVQK